MLRRSEHFVVHRHQRRTREIGRAGCGTPSTDVWSGVTMNRIATAIDRCRASSTKSICCASGKKRFERFMPEIDDLGRVIVGHQLIEQSHLSVHIANVKLRPFARAKIASASVRLN